MRIGIDARMIDHPGIGRYVRCLVAELSQRTDLALTLIGPVEWLERYPAARRRPCRVPIYSVQEQLVMPWLARGVDLVHVPHFNASAALRRPFVVTIHDLIYLNLPSLSAPVKRLACEWLIGRVVAQASRLIAVSETTKQAIMARYPGVEEKIAVIYEGCAPSIQRVTDPARLEEVRRQLRLPARFLLSVGSLRAHKNTAMLVRAFKQMRRRHAVDCQLVLVGRLDQRYQELLALLDERDEAIRWIGEVGDGELAACYSLAEAVVLPSLEEGFGLPLVEAMSCGVPAIASRIPVFMEIADHSSAWFNPYSEEELADLMYRVLQSSSWREQLAAAGRRRAQAFSWARCAQETMRVYQEAAG